MEQVKKDTAQTERYIKSYYSTVTVTMMRNGLNLMVYMLRLVETIFVATSYTRILVQF